MKKKNIASIKSKSNKAQPLFCPTDNMNNFSQDNCYSNVATLDLVQLKKDSQLNNTMTPENIKNYAKKKLASSRTHI